MEDSKDTKQSHEGVNPVRAGLFGHCPRCGKGALFNGYLELARQCDVCQLDGAYEDAADGPAALIVFLAGFIIVVLALLVEIYYTPSYWVHAVLWLPLSILIPLGMLRPLKGMMIGLQYKNNAREARFD